MGIQAGPDRAGVEADGVSHTPLSAYLDGVQRAIRRAMPAPQWVIAELSDLKRNPKGHIYLDLIEMYEGQEVAKCRGTMFAREAKAMSAQWQAATGGMPAAGMKILVSVKADFSPQYGFSLQVLSIDPSFTIGDMQAKVNQIIESLKAKGLFDMQRRLPSPTGFWRVAVISPGDAAGLADFKRDAERLQDGGICTFSYFSATFQGKDSSQSIRDALRAAFDAHQSAPFDVLCIIRGGGAKADLAWLNDEPIATWLCRIPIPVYVGIGHEVDECVLDFVASQSFGTPSKVIGHIHRALTAEASVLRLGINQAVAAMLALVRGAHAPLDGASSAFRLIVAANLARGDQLLIKADASFNSARQAILAREAMQLQAVRGRFDAGASALLAAQASRLDKVGARFREMRRSMLDREVARLDNASTIFQRTNPLALLDKGFALVRDADGGLITSAAQARSAGTLTLRFGAEQVVVSVIPAE